jgi:PTH1 family peptidyl-tRNA hydrolase
MSEREHRFIVGLGNPGRKYVGTRHNAGFDVLVELQRRWSLGAGKQAYEGLYWKTVQQKNGQQRDVSLLAPMTYMNASGRSVASMLKFYKATPADVLVVYDDLALPLGQLRARPDGSAGGHNGLSDIQRVLGTQEIARLRIGIGPCPGVMDSADFVLSKFRDHEKADMELAFVRSADAAELWLFNAMTRVMETYNRKEE